MEVAATWPEISEWPLPIPDRSIKARMYVYTSQLQENFPHNILHFIHNVM